MLDHPVVCPHLVTSGPAITHKNYWFAATIFLVGHPRPQAAKLPPLTLDLQGQQ
jgi:hypothetical protein